MPKKATHPPPTTSPHTPHTLTAPPPFPHLHSLLTRHLPQWLCHNTTCIVYYIPNTPFSLPPTPSTALHPIPEPTIPHTHTHTHAHTSTNCCTLPLLSYPCSSCECEHSCHHKSASACNNWPQQPASLASSFEFPSFLSLKKNIPSDH